MVSLVLMVITGCGREESSLPLRGSDPETLQYLFRPERDTSSFIYNLSISGNGKYAVCGLYSPLEAEKNRILFSSYSCGRWSYPVILPVPDSLSEPHEPTLSRSGRSILFSARKISAKRNDLFICNITEHGFSFIDPGHVVNTQFAEGHPFLMKNGDLVFNRVVNGRSEVMLAKWEKKAYRQVEKIINCEKDYGIRAPCMPKDMRFLIFHSKSIGAGNDYNIYIMFRKADGQYSVPVSTGGSINTSQDETFPMLSHDEKTLSFSRDRSIASILVDEIEKCNPNLNPAN